MKLARLLLLPAFALAGTLTYTAEVNPQELLFSRHGDYDLIQLANSVFVPRPGHPSLPELPLTLVIPAGALVTKVSVEPLAIIELGNYRIMPSQPAHPISKPPTHNFTPPIPAIYRTDKPFPGTYCRDFTTGLASGFQLVSISLCPLQYHPASGRLSLASKLLVTISYDDNVSSTTVLTPSQRDRALNSLVPLVANPRDLNHFAPQTLECDLPEINYLIITNNALAPHWQEFADYRSARGLRTEIRTVEWAQRSYPGRDVQECVRNLIIDYYQHRGLSYVLLAGDNAQVRCRKIRLNVEDEQGDIPTDLYYGALDYSWDSNNNNIFGEMADSIDLYADVLVGRASVDNVRQIENFIRKVAIYENRPAPDYHRRSLLPSGWLWRSIGYHGSFLNDSIADLTPAPWVDRKLVNPRNSAVVAESLDHGFVIFDPAGHGNASGVYDEDGTPIYLASNAASQRNYRRYAIMTSLACDPGDFETEDCCAEAALNCDTAGCIGVMMNSRYGWGTPPSMGPSEKLCVRFWDYYLVRNHTVLGAAHNRSREVYAGQARTSSLWRWCVTEFNLFGDPALDIWTQAPTSLTVEAPVSVPTGAQTIVATVRANGSPLADAIVTAWKANEVFATANTNAAGQATLSVHAVTTGSLFVTARKRDYLAAQASVAVTPGAPEPLIRYWRSSIDDAGAQNPNGILEPGETARLTLTVRNAGTGTATNTRIVLRPLTVGVTAPDSVAWYGTVLAGDSAAASDLLLTCSGSVLPGAIVQLLALVSNDQGQDEFIFGIEIGYPGRVAADIDTGDCALTVTARGAIGFDRTGTVTGLGFRYPKNDTSTLNTASFAISDGPNYVVDRFYSQNDRLDTDWTLADSVRQRYPLWNADEMLTAAFNDAGHVEPRSVTVGLRALAARAVPGAVVLVYDITNQNGTTLENAYAGILADFDIDARDRFHDDAWVRHDLSAVMMRNILRPDRYCGIKLLTPVAPFHGTCLDNSVYITSDSGMSESTKHRALTAEIGLPQSNRTYNWSVAIATGPLTIPPDSSQRVAFAFIGAAGSTAFEQTCTAIQDWYDANVGIVQTPTLSNRQTEITVLPNPTRGTLRINNSPHMQLCALTLYDCSGTLVRKLDTRSPTIDLPDLPTGAYVLKLVTDTGQTTTVRIAVLR